MIWIPFDMLPVEIDRLQYPIKRKGVIGLSCDYRYDKSPKLKLHDLNIE